MKIFIIAVLAVVASCCTAPEDDDSEGSGKADALRTYPMRELDGRVFGDLFAYYTGVHGKVPETVDLNFCNNLKKMWEVKEKRSRGNSVVKETRKAVIGEYCGSDPTNITLREYVSNVERIAKQVQQSIDWSTVARVERLNEREAELVKEIALSITGKDLVAYSLTELMPGVDGDMNLMVLDFIVRNGGLEYVESIPAMYDSYTSFGPYQFTQYAWYDTGREKRGGSKLNQALRAQVKHGSVSRLRGDEHHIAAYLFAIDNIAALVRRIDKRQMKTLERVYRTKHEAVVQYIATAHHQPASALSAASRWLDNDAHLPYSHSCNKRLLEYARKTEANMDALDKM
ncbi:TPA: hypothetical protein DCZ32_03435 [Candidatus Uhrbacteria bacterium]|nr:hypothetical protein [Candidatus Uhrbacteria bacterium]